MDDNQWTLDELAASLGVSRARASQITAEARRGRENPDPRTVYVYVMGGDDRRFVKIGYTRDLQKRLVQVQHSCPFTLGILWQVEGGVDLETALHRRFKGYRRQGEWFEFPVGQDAVESISRAAGEFQARSAVSILVSLLP